MQITITKSLLHFHSGEIVCFRKFIAFIQVVGFCSWLNAQEEQTKLRVIARPFGDSICLRWAPPDYASLQHGWNYGYDIWRTTIISNNETVSEISTVKLNTQAIKPFPINAWKTLNEEDDYCALLAQAMFGDTFLVTPSTEEKISLIRNKSQEQESRYAFGLFAADQSRKAAFAGGLWYSDKNVRQGEKYLYQLVYHVLPDDGRDDTAVVYTGIGENIPLPVPIGFKAESGDRQILLHWNRQYLGSFYTSYFLERAASDLLTFSPVTDLPIVSTHSDDFPSGSDIIFLDSVPENNRKYAYRMRGRSPFGEFGPWSDTLVISAILSLSIIPVITKAEQTENGSVRICWVLEGGSGDTVNSISLVRSINEKGPYDTISSMTDLHNPECIDSSPLETNYYKIVAGNKEGTLRSSLPRLVQLPDTIPPHPPEMLTGLIDSTGIVHLHWLRAPDKDVTGYRLYRSNKNFEEASLLTWIPVKDTCYTDTIILGSLSDEIFYSIMSIDHRQNHSPLSGPFRIAKPDYLPPSPPLILSASANNNGIMIQWLPSHSGDVSYHLILRKEKELSEKILDTCYPSIKSEFLYIDSAVYSGIAYSYYIKAVDHAGNIARSPTQLTAYSNKKQIVSSQETWKLIADRRKNLIYITITQNNPAPSRCIIYKSAVSTPLQIVTVLGPDEKTWIDSNVLPDTEYSYLVKMEFSEVNYFVSDATKTIRY